MTGNMKLKLAFFTFIIFCGTSFGQGNAKFRVVLDPGHGGKDYGAIYHSFVEKNIALSVALKVGKILEDQDVQVIYTRKTDVFIELTERPNIANKSDADLFVSIHCNGEAKKTAFGTETFVIGPTKNASNLEVARNENSVITLEKDYKEKYRGFDPNAPETIIGIAIQQEENIYQSIDLASKIQDGFTNGLKRKDRSVKRAPFWVLHRTAMPSVLIEMGFLSYKPEGEYLNSESGQNELAQSIAKSIIAYKREYFTAGTNTYKEPVASVATTPEPATTRPAATAPAPAAPKAVANAPKGVVFKVQIAASGTVLDLVPSNFKGLQNISKDDSTAVIKYFYGATDDYAEAKGKLLEEAKAKGFTSAFVVAYANGKKITVQEALNKK